MNIKNLYPVLYEAYEHYLKTGDRRYFISPKNPDFLLNVLDTLPFLQENGYIDNVSDKLLNNEPINLIPAELLSFDITYDGIRFTEAHRDS